VMKHVKQKKAGDLAAQSASSNEPGSVMEDGKPKGRERGGVDECPLAKKLQKGKGEEQEETKA
jgi:hypothetical protein